VAPGSITRRVPTRAVATTPGDQHDHDEHDHDEGDDTEHLHPAWSTSHLIRLLGHIRLLAAVSHSLPSLRDIVSPGNQSVTTLHGAYIHLVPKLWNETIEAHRREVRKAILDATADLVAEHGLRAVTMSQVAEEAGIGRATLYKYFSDVETILRAWHERQISAHLDYLTDVREQAGSPGERLEAVLEAYASISHESHRHHNAELVAFLHRDEQVGAAEQRLRTMIRDLLADGAASGDLRDDVAPDELARYCLHALAAARSLPSKAAVRRLVDVTLAGLRPDG
jgi:AcrR family transcriptional regulator